jgi:hypothetical protein
LSARELFWSSSLSAEEADRLVIFFGDQNYRASGIKPLQGGSDFSEGISVKWIFDVEI